MDYFNSVYVDMVKEVAEELDLPYIIVKDACDSQFKFIAEAIDEGDKFIFESYKAIRLFKIGTFFPKKRILAKKREQFLKFPELFTLNSKGKVIFKKKTNGQSNNSK